MARALPDRPILRNAIALSVAVHVVALLGLAPRSHRGAWGAEPLNAAPADQFAGDSPVAGDLYEVAMVPDSPAQDQASVASQAPPEAEAQPEPEPEAEPAADPEPTAEPVVPRETKPGAPQPAAAANAARTQPAATQPASAQPASTPPPAAHPGPPGASSPTGAAGPFGASGGAGGARNLAYAFTRAIPPMSDSDPAWAALPVGDAGEMQLTIAVDDDGHIVKVTIAKAPEAPPHLRRLAEKVGTRLRLGVFALRPTQVGNRTLRLRIRARVRDVPVPEDVPAGPFDLRFEFADDHGQAGFTQINGRRVDLDVDLMDE